MEQQLQKQLYYTKTKTNNYTEKELLFTWFLERSTMYIVSYYPQGTKFC